MVSEKLNFSYVVVFYAAPCIPFWNIITILLNVRIAYHPLNKKRQFKAQISCYGCCNGHRAGH